MECTHCQRANPPDAQFCLGCGAQFALQCNRCGTELPADANFCLKCGQPIGAASGPVTERDPRSYTPKHLADKILQSKSAIEGERKQVTVLFADVKGSMELAEQLDPEEWHGILDRFFQILTEGVHRFEGTVNQYTGDGIMALFGAPIAHEDHAQRACYAALWLRDSLKEYADALRVGRGLNFSVRMGLNSGEVIVGKIGDDLRMDYTAQGHTVGLAQRMEALAEAGKALLASHTLDLVEGYFELRDLGETRVRGVGAPVRVAELEGVGRMRTRLDRSRARGLSRFVGRAEEMERLEAALERALAGNGEVIGVMAEAGGGKSRLCHEFAERCRARGIIVRSTTGVPHGHAVPLQPMIEFYGEVFGIEADDGDAMSRQKIAGVIAQIAPEELAALPLLFEFMRVPDPAQPVPEQTPQERSRATLEMLHRITVARSRRQPALLIFEDLHWLDPETERVVEMMVDATAATRTLLVANFRPEYRSDWMGRTHYQQVSLRPLDATAATELLTDWLGSDPSLEGFAEMVRDRTGGNPFFMEEVVQAQIEAGGLVGTRGHFRLERPLQSLEVPESVQSLLAARIDRLGETAKRLLQTAAVVGDEFSEPLLAWVEERDGEAQRGTLRELVQSEFIYEQSLYPELEYAFKHPLTREVAYGTLLGERRREVHVRAAEAIEARAGEAVDAQAALLAHHWERAGRPLEAARWQTRAGLRLGAAQPRESLFHWRKVTELLDGEPASPEVQTLAGQARARLIYATSRSQLPEEEVVAVFEDALKATGEGDSVPRVQALNSYVLAHRGFGRQDEARALARQGAEMALRLGEPGLIAVALSSEIMVNSSDEPRRAVELYRQLAEVCAADPRLGLHQAGSGVPPLVLGSVLTILALSNLGQGEEAASLLVRLRDVLEDAGDGMEQVMMLMASAMSLGRRGDLTSALSEARRCLEQSQRMSNPAFRVLAHNALGQVCWRAGRLEEAEEQMQRAVEIGLDGRLSTSIGISVLGILAQVQLARGRTEAAREAANRGIEESVAYGLRVTEAACRISLGRVLLAESSAEAVAAARAELARAEAAAHARGVQSLIAEAEEVRAEIAAFESDVEQRARSLREAARLHRLCGDEHAAARAEAAVSASDG